MRIIGLEEHVVTDDVVGAWSRLPHRWQDLSLRPSTEGDRARRLADLGDDRRQAMDDAGVDVHVLSLSTPGVHNLEPADAVALQRSSNDVIADAVRSHPLRYQGLATLATPDPAEAARELERAVTVLGLDGAMLFGRTRERNVDRSGLWPVFEAAAALRAPLYLHPQSPPPAVREAYYSGPDGEPDPALATFGIGWHYETGVQLLRMILDGVFDRFPDLQVIVGHWGELVLFYLGRLVLLPGLARLERPLHEYFRSNVFITPSGMYSQRYLQWAVEVVGADRVLFSTDYPFELTTDGGARRFLEQAHLEVAERDGIASGNWERLRAGIRR